LKTASLSKPSRRPFSPSIDFDLLPEFFKRIDPYATSASKTRQRALLTAKIFQRFVASALV